MSSEMDKAIAKCERGLTKTLGVVLVAMVAAYVSLSAAVISTYTTAEVSKPTMVFTTAKAYLSVNTPNATTLYSTPVADTSNTKTEFTSFLMSILLPLTIGYGVVAGIVFILLDDNTKYDLGPLIVHTWQYVINCIVWTISGQVFLYFSGNKTSEASYGVAAASITLASCIYFIESMVVYRKNYPGGSNAVLNMELKTMLGVIGVITPVVMVTLLLFGIVGSAYDRTKSTNTVNDFMNTGFALYATTLAVAVFAHIINLMMLISDKATKMQGLLLIGLFFHVWTFVYVTVFVTYGYRNFQVGYAL